MPARRSALCIASLCLILALAWAIPPALIVYADEITVPGDYATIQLAIDNANDGDVILIASGTYGENLTIGTNKALTLRGAGPTATILDGRELDRVIDCDSALTLQSLTVTNGKSFSGGGGIWAEGSLMLSNTQFISNNGGSGGGGVSCLAAVQASDCLFEGNLAACGGGVRANGCLMLNNTQFIGNIADEGGGAYCLAAVQVSDCLFEGNLACVAGGGVYAEYSVTLSKTQFISNSGNEGGGVCCLDLVQASDCRFEGNRAGRAGGVYAVGSLTLSNTQFVSNRARRCAGGAYASSTVQASDCLFEGNQAELEYGGGLCADGNVTLSNTQFISNSARLYGGGALSYSTVKATACHFEGNQAKGDSGGGVFATASLTLSNTQFINNSAGRHGGGAFGKSVQTSDCLFEGNQVEVDGGAVWAEAAGVVNCLFAGNTARGVGQALWVGPWEPAPSRLLLAGSEILHCTFANPTALTGAAIYVKNIGLGVYNTLFANYDTGIELVGSTLFLNDYNLYDQVTDPISGGALMGAHSRVGPARFVNPSSGDYHLRAGSLAIDRGRNRGVLTDLDGLPRDDPPDIGCYESDEVGEFPGLAATAGPELVCPGWGLYYQWTLTNPLLTLENATVSLVLPPNTCCPSPWQTLVPAWSYDEGTRTVTWELGSVARDAIVNGTVKVHTMSTLADGQVVTGTFMLLADCLTEPVVAEAAAQGDTDACGGGVVPSTPTPTPTETASPTVTPTPSATPLPPGFSCLPVIIKANRSLCQV